MDANKLTDLEIENRIIAKYLEIYPTPIDKFDKQAKKFDYYDMLEFAQNVFESLTESAPKEEEKEDFKLEGKDLELFNESTKAMMEIGVLTFSQLGIPNYIEAKAINSEAEYFFRMDRKSITP